jgi:hypothetical protein
MSCAVCWWSVLGSAVPMAPNPRGLRSFLEVTRKLCTCRAVSLGLRRAFRAASFRVVWTLSRIQLSLGPVQPEAHRPASAKLTGKSNFRVGIPGGREVSAGPELTEKFFVGNGFPVLATVSGVGWQRELRRWCRRGGGSPGQANSLDEATGDLDPT